MKLRFLRKKFEKELRQRKSPNVSTDRKISEILTEQREWAIYHFEKVARFAGKEISRISKILSEIFLFTFLRKC